MTVFIKTQYLYTRRFILKTVRDNFKNSLFKIKIVLG